MSVQKFEYNSQINPSALTPENIQKITDGLAQRIAQEVAAAPQMPPDVNFHIRIGGEHSRSFSKTAEHKNVLHSKIVIEGKLP